MTLLRTCLRWIAVLLLVTAGVMAAPAHAWADSDDDAITRHDVHATVNPDGSLDVSLDFDFDFGDDTGHGPYLTLPERMAIDGDPDHWRSLPISDIAADSPTAATPIEIDRESGAVQIRIGDEDVDLEGVHRYQVSYRIAGVINPNAAGSGLDELSWNPIGTEWEVPLSQVSVRIDTPAAIEQTACFTGSDYDTSCDAEPPNGTTATFGPVDLQPGEGLQVVVGMPGGSLPEAQPILIERYTAGRVLGTNPVSGGIGAAVLALGAGLGVGLVRRAGDRQFSDVAAGTIPDGGGPLGKARHRRADRSPQVRPVPHPPPDVTPGQIGVLADTLADQKDITATVIDLAVRGHLRIEEYDSFADGMTDDQETNGDGETDDKKSKDEEDDVSWKLVRTPSDGELRPYEQELLDGLFVDGPELDLATAGTVTAASTACQQALYREVTDELGWFRGNPSRVRTRWVLAGLGILVVGIALTFALGFTLGLGFVGIGLVVVGILTMVLAAWAPGRTALGTAIHVQAKGFREHLESTNADTLEAASAAVQAGGGQGRSDVDTFSQYLPYAIVWGLAEEWTGAFEELAARGTAFPFPSWYVGSSYAMFASGSDGRSFGDAITGLTGATTSAMTAASTSSGGASGFSGGGGVGGGGGGGW